MLTTSAFILRPRCLLEHENRRRHGDTPALTNHYFLARREIEDALNKVRAATGKLDEWDVGQSGTTKIEWSPVERLVSGVAHMCNKPVCRCAVCSSFEAHRFTSAVISSRKKCQRCLTPREVSVEPLSKGYVFQGQGQLGVGGRCGCFRPAARV